MTKSTQKKILIGFFLYSVSLGTLSGFLLIKNVWLFFSMTGVAWIFSLSVCIITFILSWRAVQNYTPPDPEKFLFIKRDQIPWSTIDTISLIAGTLGNQVLVFYFNDGTPPKSYNFDKLKKKDELILSIKEHASKNGYTIDLNV
jgi:hypothetical protein